MPGGKLHTAANKLAPAPKVRAGASARFVETAKAKVQRKADPAILRKARAS